jgi:ectoine hydroxylase-related dioxygenase (phytanoyl-CoA dioxygenase family)
MGILTVEQLEHFKRDGYLKFGPAVDPAEVENMRAGLERVIVEEQQRDSDEGLPPEFVYGHDRKSAKIERRSIHQFLNMWKIDDAYRRAINNPKITQAVRELMGVDRVRIWHDQVISKPPGDNDLFGCHHDFYFWPLDRPGLIACWLALDDANVENGCMHVFPGSHRDPRYQPANCDLADDLNLSPVPGGPGEPGSLYDEIRQRGPETAVPVELKAGECMFHHCLNYHLTPRNSTDRQRRAFVMIFMPDGTRYNHQQSPGHPCTSYLHLEDSVVMGGENFPVCG